METTNQRMLFPEPAIKELSVTCASEPCYNHTFPMNPQQGARRLPFLKDILVENPSRGSLVMGAARDVVIR